MNFARAEAPQWNSDFINKTIRSNTFPPKLILSFNQQFYFHSRTSWWLKARGGNYNYLSPLTAEIKN